MWSHPEAARGARPKMCISRCVLIPHVASAHGGDYLAYLEKRQEAGPSFLGNHYLLGHVTASQIGVEYRTLYILYETLSTHTQKKFK